MDIRKILFLGTIIVAATISLVCQSGAGSSDLYDESFQRKLILEGTPDVHSQTFQTKLRGGYTVAVKQYVDANDIKFDFNFENDKIVLFNPEILSGQIWQAHIEKLGRTIGKIIIMGGFGKEYGKIVSLETDNK